MARREEKKTQMSTSLNIMPPDEEEEEEVDFDNLPKGHPVFVQLGTKLYHGTVDKDNTAGGEISILTSAARHMSRQWKTLLFYKNSRKPVYGSATLIIPPFDQIPTHEFIIHEEYKPKPRTEIAEQGGDDGSPILDQQEQRDDDTCPHSDEEEKEQQRLWWKEGDG